MHAVSACGPYGGKVTTVREHRKPLDCYAKEPYKNRALLQKIIRIVRGLLVVAAPCVCLCVYVCLCECVYGVCVCVREREREKVCVCMCECVWVCVWVCVFCVCTSSGM